MLDKIKEFAKKEVVKDTAIVMVQGAVWAVAFVSALIVVTATVGFVAMEINPELADPFHKLDK